MVRIADIAGRLDDDFRYGAQTIPAAAFRYVLGTDPAVAEYQVHQTRTGAVVHVVGRPDVAALTTALAASFRRFGLAEPELRVVPVPRIERLAATGKLKRFVPLRP